MLSERYPVVKFFIIRATPLLHPAFPLLPIFGNSICASRSYEDIREYSTYSSIIVTRFPARIIFVVRTAHILPHIEHV